MVHETSDLVIDGLWRNHKECQFDKIGDVWKNWCLDNMGSYLWTDGKSFDRIVDKGMDLVGIAYDLVRIVWDHDSCATDAKWIDVIATVFEDFSNASTYVYGFDDKWDPSSIKHIEHKDFKKAVRAYKDNLEKEAEEKKEELTKKFMPNFEVIEIFKMPQWGQGQDFDFRHLF